MSNSIEYVPQVSRFRETSPGPKRRRPKKQPLNMTSLTHSLASPAQCQSWFAFLRCDVTNDWKDGFQDATGQKGGKAKVIS